MADAPKKDPSYLSQVASFYFSPEIRSAGTLVYLAIFGYFTLYYVNNLLLAVRFLFYILLGQTALSGTAFLFTSLVFVVTLAAPFFLSFYSIFVLHRVWDKKNWSSYAKWTVTALILASSVLIIIVCDDVSRWAASRPSLQSFVEDAGLSGKI